MNSVNYSSRDLSDIKQEQAIMDFRITHSKIVFTN